MRTGRVVAQSGRAVREKVGVTPRWRGVHLELICLQASRIPFIYALDCGPLTETRRSESFTGKSVVNAIPSSGVDVAAGRPTMNTTTGSESVVVVASGAGRPSPFSHCFLSLTP